MTTTEREALRVKLRGLLGEHPVPGWLFVGRFTKPELDLLLAALAALPEPVVEPVSRTRPRVGGVKRQKG